MGEKILIEKYICPSESIKMETHYIPQIAILNCIYIIVYSNKKKKSH